MAYIDSVYFTDMGPDTGRGYPPLLFLHGFFMDSRMFEKQISVLKEKYRVICIDIRGFGGSTDHRGPFSLYDIAGDLIKVADHLNIRKFVIAGMSMGGYIALRICLKYPGRVNGLILMGSQVARDNEETVKNYLYLRDHWHDTGIREELVNRLLPVIIGEHCPDHEFWQKIWMSHSHESISHAMDAMLKRDDITHKVKSITVPALILHGEKDTGIPVSAACTSCNLLKYARFIEIPGGAHAFNIRHSSATNRAILSWLHDYF